MNITDNEEIPAPHEAVSCPEIDVPPAIVNPPNPKVVTQVRGMDTSVLTDDILAPVYPQDEIPSLVTPLIEIPIPEDMVPIPILITSTTEGDKIALDPCHASPTYLSSKALS